MHQHRHREEQPHEVILPRQRRGHRHQAEQQAQLFRVRPLGAPRRRRHHGNVAEAERERHHHHDQVRGLEADVGDIHGARRPSRIVLIVVDRPGQPVRHRDDRLIDP
jgi:hypothetical protein